MQPAAGHGEAWVSEFAGNLMARSVHVAQAHAEFFAADAKAVARTGTVCHQPISFGRTSANARDIEFSPVTAVIRYRY